MNDNESQSTPSVEDRIAAKLFGGDSEPSSEPSAQENTASVEQTEEQTAEPQAQDSNGFDTVEFKGKTYQVPTEIKDALLRESDYTTKTQEVAQLRKTAELKAKVVEDNEAFGKSVQTEVSNLRAIDSQIQQYKQLKWDELSTEQMVLAGRNLDALKEQKAELTQSLNTKHQEFMKGRETKQQELIGETVKYLSTKVQGWSDKHGIELTGYAKDLGYPQESVLNIFSDPVLTHALWKAKQWDSLQASKGDVKNKVNQAPPIVKPGSSNPEFSKKMNDAKQLKEIKSATTQTDKAKLIQKMLESRFFKD